MLHGTNIIAHIMSLSTWCTRPGLEIHSTMNHWLHTLAAQCGHIFRRLARSRPVSGEASEADAGNATLMPEQLWSRLLRRHSFLVPLNPDEARRLQALCMQFIRDKQFSAAGGHELDDEIIASIAVQATLPVLELGLGAYPEFSEIIVYPGEFLVERDIEDDHGVVHPTRETLSGEAWEGGPVILSWADASGDDADPLSSHGNNVVIHEFAHKLDMANGEVDGLPAFYRTLHGDLDAAAWCTALSAAHEDLIERIEALEAGFPKTLDPESDEALELYAKLPLDPYAATDPGEFFSVCAEAFFVDPERLTFAYPAVYDQLKRYFRQDPLQRLRTFARQSP